MPFSLTAAFLIALLAAAQPADIADTGEAGPAWRGHMQCTAAWTDPADDARQWTLSTENGSTNIKLWIADHARAGDPPPFSDGETRELVPREAQIAMSSLGAGPVEVTSIPREKGMVMHDITLGHVEKLDVFPDRFTLTLTIKDAPPLAIEMREFAAARAYLKRCLAGSE